MANSKIETDLVANDRASAVLKQCEAQIQQYAATATSSLASVATKWMTVGGLAGTAMGYVTGSMAQNIVELDRNAKALGVNVQAYQVFQTSARKAGVEGEQFRAVMGRFEYVLGMAKSGVGEGANAFRTLGLSMTQVGSASPEQAFRMVIDSMSKITDQSKRAAVAQMIFGEQGIRMMGMMEAGTKGLADTEAKMKSRGTLYDEAQIEQMRQAQRAISELQNAFAGAGGQMAITFSPMVKDAAKALTSMMQVASGFTVSHKDLILQVAAGGAAFYGTVKAWNLGAAAISALSKATKEATIVEAIFQAMSGPAGWVKLAAGTAAAVAATYAVEAALKSASKAHEADIAKSREAAAAKETEAEAARKTADALAVEAAARKKAGDALLSYLERFRAKQGENQSLDEKFRQYQQVVQNASPEVQRAWGVTPEQKTDPQKYGGKTLEEWKADPEAFKKLSTISGTFQRWRKTAEKEAAELAKWQATENAGGPEFRKYVQGEQRKEHYGIEPDKFEGVAKAIAKLNVGLASGEVSLTEYERTVAKLREAYGPDVLTAQQEYEKNLETIRRGFQDSAYDAAQFSARIQKALDTLTGTSEEASKSPSQRYKERLTAIDQAEKDKQITPEQARSRREQLSKNSFSEDLTSDAEKFRASIDALKARIAAQLGGVRSVGDYANLSGMAAEGQRRLADQAFSSQVKPGDEKSLKDALEKIRAIQAEMNPAEFRQRYKDWASGVFGVDIKTPTQKVADMAKRLAEVTKGMEPEAQKRLREAAGKKLAQETGAQAIIDAQKTPMEKLRDKSKELDELVAAGQLTEQQKNIAMGGTMKELLPAAKPAQFEAAESLYKRIQGAAAGSGSEDPQKMIAELMKQSQEQQKKAAEDANKTKTALEKYLPEIAKKNGGCGP